MDVVTAFLHRRLDEEVYMTIPPHMHIKGNTEGKVLRMLGALYGLKQSSHVWNKKFHEFMIHAGFQQLKWTHAYTHEDQDRTELYWAYTSMTRPLLVLISKLSQNLNRKWVNILK